MKENEAARRKARRRHRMLKATVLCTRLMQLDVSKRRLWMVQRPQGAVFWSNVLENFNEDQWRQHFRMSRDTFEFVLQLVELSLRRKLTNWRKPLEPRRRLVIVLWWYATPGEYRTISCLFGVGLSTVCTLVHEVTATMKTKLLKRFISLPKGEALQKALNGFAERGFTDVYVGWPGRTHDACVLSNSPIFKMAEQQGGYLFPRENSMTVNDVEVPVHLIGDAAYPLKNWLMKGFTNHHALTPQQRHFNYRLSSARMVVENAFGRLKVTSINMSEQFKKCVHPCPRYISGSDTHQLCVLCLGVQHARAALEGAACSECDKLPLRTLRSRLAVFDQHGQAREPRGSGPAIAEAERRRRSWGSQMDLSAGHGTATASSQSSSEDSDVLPPRVEAREAASSREAEDQMLQLSGSEESDDLNIEAGDATLEIQTPAHAPAQEELVEVLTRAVAKLNIDWPQEEPQIQPPSKLDERFFKHRSQPPRRGLPFFPDLHNELCKSWDKPFSARLSNPPVLDFANVVGAAESGYGRLPRVEEALASYLSPEAASSLKAPVLPTKPCRDTSALVGRAYMAAGRAGGCLHTMAVLQAYQADLLKELDEGQGPSPEDIVELRKATDLSLRITKETARAIGRSMAGLVCVERHLWLNLSGMKEKEKHFLLDSPISPFGLFGGAVDTVVGRFQEVKKQSAAFQQYLPRRSSSSRKAASKGQPQPSASSSHRQVQKQSVASRAPPEGAWQRRRRSRGKPSEPKVDLRTVLQAKKASSKRS
ncbi:unnamed protein product [Leuciscus chuanchicus]